VRRLSLALAALLAPAAIAGCTSDPGGGNPDASASGSGGKTTGSGGNASGSGGNSGSGGSGSGSGGTSGSGGSTVITVACSTAALGSPALRLMTRSEIQSTLADAFPEVKTQWSASLPANTISDFGFDNDQGATVGTQLAGSILDTAKSVATAVTGNALSTLLPCSTSAADRKCAETFLAKYGPRLFRRPLTTAEHDKYLTFFDASKTKSDFKTALKWMTVGLIQSPVTLYRSEIGTDKGDGTRALTAYEMASELSYMYTGSAPTDAMLTSAGSGNLGDAGALAKTLLATDAGKQMLQRFFEQYLDYANVTSVAKGNIQNFSQLSGDMVKETHAFIDDIVFQKGGGVKELLTATTTNPSKALAAYYATGNAYSGGFPMPATDYASVTRPTKLGIGILAQGSFLATHASSTTSSPTKRGLFPYRKLFCKPKLTPPPNIPSIDQMPTTTVPINTTRDRYELSHQLTNGPTGPCANCHKLFDPMGFGFEHFDEGGRYRAKEGTFDINSAASSLAPDGSTLMFTDQESLMNGLAGQPVIHECLAAYLAMYSFGSNEACIGASQVADLRAGKIGIADAFAKLATEPHFSKRSSK
jgi:hypothetical protein